MRLTAVARLIILLGAAGACLSPDVRADGICPARCEGRWQERALLLASSDTYGDVGLGWNLSAWRWLRAPDGIPPVSVDPDGESMPEVVYRPEDLQMHLRYAAESCYRIKYLGYFSHGAPGAIYFNHTSLDVSRLEMLRGYECVMADDATIELSGCNVGRGCAGQNFMAGLATRLLPRGGRVVANTFYSSTFAPGVLPHFSLNFDSQTLYVRRGASGPEIDTGQDEQGWDNEAISGETCRQELSACLTELDGHSRRLNGCQLNEEQNALLTHARRTLNEAGSLVLRPASEFGPRLGDAAIAGSAVYANQANMCQMWNTTLEAYETCRPGPASASDGAGAPGAR